MKIHLNPVFATDDWQYIASCGGHHVRGHTQSEAVGRLILDHGKEFDVNINPVVFPKYSQDYVVTIVDQSLYPNEVTHRCFNWRGMIFHRVLPAAGYGDCTWEQVMTESNNVTVVVTSEDMIRRLEGMWHKLPESHRVPQQFPTPRV